MANRGRQFGFSLIELMIVVAVLAIVIAVAIPSLFNSRKSAIETRAIAYLRTIVTVNEQYKARFDNYASSEDDLIAARYIPSIDAGVRSLEEYTFTYNSTGSFWTGSMDPVDPGVGGDRHFYADATGVIRFDSNGTADSTSDPVGER